MTNCRGPQCTRPAVAHEICASHYAQERRSLPLTPIRARGATVLTLRVPEWLRDAARADALRLGQTESDWWRAAALLAITNTYGPIDTG